METKKSEDGNMHVTIDAQPPFTFGLGLQGELQIAWTQGELPGGILLRAHLVIPSQEVETLRQGLNENKTVQETLAAKPPTQSKH